MLDTHVHICIYSYDDMLLCWKWEPSERPTFLELKSHYESIIEAKQEGSYLDFNTIFQDSTTTEGERKV